METIKGYVQEEPEMRFIPNGTPVTSIYLADTEEAEHDKKQRVIAWEWLAEIVNQLLQTGDFIYAKGYYKTRSWEGQDGQPHSVTELIAKQIWNKDYKDIMELTDLPINEVK